MDNSAIALQEVSKKFGPHLAINNISFTIPTGTIFGFLGPNGAGKTTTARIINGIVDPSSGIVSILGKNIKKDPHRIRQKCGVQTDTNVYESITAFENLAIWAKLYGVADTQINIKVKSLLMKFGLWNRAHEKVGKFSKGMKQKVLIARSLIHDPEILFLDEPSAGLDPEATEDLLQLLEAYVKNTKKTVFVCSHRLEEVERLADMVGIINKGRLVACERKADLISRYSTANTFNISFLEPYPKTAWLERIKILEKDKMSIKIETQNESDISEIISSLVRQNAQILEVKKDRVSLQDIYLKLMPNSGL